MIRRSLHFCWPRAETRIYQEPKNLVEHGLVKATTTAKGQRARTEYAITAKGRKALRAWMGQPSEWARWARAEIERWPDVDSGEVSPEVVRAFEAALAETPGAGAGLGSF